MTRMCRQTVPARLSVSVAAVIAFGMACAADRETVESEDTRIEACVPAPGASPPAPAAPGHWDDLPPAPLTARFGQVAVWTGREVVVWGGYRYGGNPAADGAAFDPETRTWRRIADAPISGRGNAAATWTGSEMIVAGGFGGDTGRERQSDAAAYDPATDTWARVADPPSLGNEPRWASTGTEVLVLERMGESFAAFDLASCSWRGLAAFPLRPRHGFSITWTGSEVIVWGGASGTNSPYGDGASWSPSRVPAPSGTPISRD